MDCQVSQLRGSLLQIPRAFPVEFFHHNLSHGDVLSALRNILAGARPFVAGSTTA